MSTVNPVSDRLATSDSRLELETSRPRQTQRPGAPFRDLLASGVDLLMSGAEVATHVVAGPILAATVHDARNGAAVALARPGSSMAPAAGPASGQPQPAAVTAMLQDGQLSSAQLLVLQQQIQEENQRFSTLSNVMRARHDTAKAAVSNIRA